MAKALGKVMTRAKAGDYIVTRRPHVWQAVVGWGGLTLAAIGVCVFAWTVVTLVFSLGKL